MTLKCVIAYKNSMGKDILRNAIYLASYAFLRITEGRLCIETRRANIFYITQKRKIDIDQIFCYEFFY